MKNIFDKYVKVCPKSGKFRGFRTLTGLSKFLFPIIGLVALLWIIFRVVSKPTRIEYPCVKAAMPFASGFVGEIILLSLSALAFMKSKEIFLPLLLFCQYLLLY